MDIKDNEALQRVVQHYTNDYGVRLRFIGQNHPTWAASLMVELINNSPLIREFDDKFFSKDVRTIEESETAVAAARSEAKTRVAVIDIVFGQNFLLINDYFSQPKVHRSMQNIQTALNSDLPFSTKRYTGGAGLFSAKITLKERSGCLTYRRIGTKIVTVASWDSTIKTELD